MANIILKGRDADGNIVETIYENIMSVAFETEEGGTVIFHESDVTAGSFNQYLGVPAENGGMLILAKGGAVNGKNGKAISVNETYLEEYGKLDENNNRFLWFIVTLKTLTVGEVYQYSEFIF